MSVDIKSETLAIGGTEATIISVKNGEAAIGTCSAGYLGMGGVGAKTRLFYIGNDPIVNVICPNHGNVYTDKLISLCPGFMKYDNDIKKTIDNCYSRLSNGDPALSSIREIISLLQDGVYALYFSEYYPTDGSGVFFWGAYNIPHDIHGTAEQNRLIKSNVFKPCFLIPTQPLDYYSPKVKVGLEDTVKKRPVQGIVYHLSGFHSMLLKGHHGAVACAEQSIPFRCLVIEKICTPYTDPIVLSPAPANTEVPENNDDAQENPEAAAPAENDTVEESSPNAPENVVYPEGITGFRSASIKIPLELFPKDMLRFILTALPEYKPRSFEVISAKLNTTSKKAVSNNVLPLAALEKADAMPDCEMLESAYAIKSLSDEQLSCLLAGDVECRGQVIISPNFYSSIVTACNYLQFTDPNRFVDFAIAIMDNPELIATHDYVSHRALTQNTNTKLQRFFQSVVDSDDAKYNKVTEAAETFLRRLMENR